MWLTSDVPPDSRTLLDGVNILPIMMAMGHALPTLDNLDTFLQICNPDDSLQVLLMIEMGSGGFASLVMDYAVSQVASR
ncbi:unnamed protein product [Schistocephalus solidus]|uniref:Protein kinase domain-containing protein n=1 Tax=Schistocephalus solidus TaxID=70667 RepID=A0A183T803_SCHSO|nr:unnamed protein product [Schistocephalus solidus]